MKRKTGQNAEQPVLEGRLARELETFRCMTAIYCRDHHPAENRSGTRMCKECTQFMQYAERRLQKCPYGQAKPTCAKCPVHCYKVKQREHARDIMRHAGPKMPIQHPLRSLGHLFDKLRTVEHPMDVRRKKISDKKKPHP